MKHGPKCQNDQRMPLHHGAFMGQEAGETPSTLWVPRPCGCTHTDDFFCTHHSHRERERAKQRSPAHVAATFQQRPHINTTDLILEMARKEKSERKKGGRKGRGSYKRQRKSCAATWNSRRRRPPPSGFTFGRRFIAHFFTSPWLAWLARHPQTSGASPLIIHSYFQSQSVSARAG